MVKVSKEVLTLFDIIITDEAPDFESLTLCHALSDEALPQVKTTLSLTDLAGRTTTDVCADCGEPNEPVSVAFHRLVKLNFYQLLRRRLGMTATP